MYKCSYCLSRPFFLRSLASRSVPIAIGILCVYSVYSIKKPELNDSGKPCSRNRNILHFISDGRKEGLNKEHRIASQLFFYAFIFHSNLRLDSVYGIKKPELNDSGFPCRQEHRIIEPDLGGVANNHLTK